MFPLFLYFHLHVTGSVQTFTAESLVDVLKSVTETANSGHLDVRSLLAVAQGLVYSLKECNTSNVLEIPDFASVLSDAGRRVLRENTSGAIMSPAAAASIAGMDTIPTHTTALVVCTPTIAISETPITAAPASSDDILANRDLTIPVTPAVAPLAPPITTRTTRARPNEIPYRSAYMQSFNALDLPTQIAHLINYPEGVEFERCRSTNTKGKHFHVFYYQVWKPIMDCYLDHCGEDIEIFRKANALAMKKGRINRQAFKKGCCRSK